MSATDKLRGYYQNLLEMLSLDELHYLSKTLGESKRRNKKDTIKYILFVLPMQLMALSYLATSPKASVEFRGILGAIIPVIKLEEKYTNKEMGDNVAVNITRDRDGYTFEILTRFFDEMSDPQFRIEVDDVNAYIVSTSPWVYDGPITTDVLSSILSRYIGYVPRVFTDFECMVVVYSLLMMDFLPPIDVRMSVNRILYLLNGNDLKRYLTNNLDTEDRDLLESQL
ncbi:hypothetical protein N7527_004669 [Penicillium freii]|nr:hypothetical protein N7527_004669 [Penicillium freii]